jgi:hypothetical protein
MESRRRIGRFITRPTGRNSGRCARLAPTKDLAALGLRTHSGWAALVAVSGDPKSPEVILRRRIELADGRIEGSKQPYHAAEGLATAEAASLIRRFEEGSRRLAVEAFRSAIAKVEKCGRRVAACGYLLASGRPLGDLADTLASHAKIHTADGEHFRNAIARAAARYDLDLTKVREPDVWEKAANEMRVSVDSLQARISAIGKTLGPPWRQDEKLATVAGCLALTAASRR